MRFNGFMMKGLSFLPLSPIWVVVVFRCGIRGLNDLPGRTGLPVAAD
jgi:hypothetical protein